MRNPIDHPLNNLQSRRWVTIKPYYTNYSVAIFFPCLKVYVRLSNIIFSYKVDAFRHWLSKLDLPLSFKISTVLGNHQNYSTQKKEGTNSQMKTGRESMVTDRVGNFGKLCGAGCYTSLKSRRTGTGRRTAE